MGLPPNWYKAAPYRARIVIEPRNVLAEFGVDVAPDVEVRVWDSNAEIRYMVLPMRPAGTEGWSEEKLAESRHPRRHDRHRRSQGQGLRQSWRTPMNGIHDLGGMQGFGPVEREENEPVFHADWERRIFALLNLTIAAGQYHVDEIRHSIERMPPAEYLMTPYYEHWLHAAEDLLDKKGVVTHAELERRMAELAKKGGK